MAECSWIYAGAYSAIEVVLLVAKQMVLNRRSSLSSNGLVGRGDIFSFHKGIGN